MLNTNSPVADKRFGKVALLPRQHWFFEKLCTRATYFLLFLAAFQIETISLEGLALTIKVVVSL